MNNKYRYYLYPFLIFLILAALIFRTNAANIYGAIANSYYKKNDISKAKLYYERAIHLNKKDYKNRENYVDMLIKQPMTIDSQEALVKIAEGVTDDAAKIKSESFLNELKREVLEKYPDNYILHAPYNQKIVHWGKLPITYSYKTYDVPEDILAGVEEAFQEWENADNSVLKFKRVKDNADIVIYFIENNSRDVKLGEKYVVAYTTPSINDNNLLNMTIKFNLKDIEGNLYTQNQIYNTALHEIFHALGFMGHSYDKNNIMHMSKDNYSIQKDSRHALTEADILTMKLLYKVKPDITNSNELVYDYVPYLVVGSIDNRNYSKSKEAKNYIEKAPTLPNGYLDYAETLVAQKKYSEAVRYLKKALTLSHNNDSMRIIYYDLAVCYYYLESFDNAEKYLNMAMQMKNNDDEMHYLCAEIALKKNNIKKAINEYNYLVSKYPDNINYSINLANIYIKRRNYLEARKVIKNFIKNNPDEKNNPNLSAYKMLKF